MESTHRVLFQPAQNINKVDDESISLVVTSPPYPMIEMWDGIFAAQNQRIDEKLRNEDGSSAFELMNAELDKVWLECYRVLKPGGFACINIGDATRKIGKNFRLYTNHSRITRYCEDIGFQSLPLILWQKQTNAPNKFMGSGMLPSGAYVTLEHEYILIFRKGNKKTFPTEERETRGKSAFFWEERNVWFSDLWDFKGIKQKIGNSNTRKRSAAYPFELAFRLVNMYSMAGDYVLDPFLGTGTTLVAAMAAGRNSIGVEIDEGFEAVIWESIQGGCMAANDRQVGRLLEHTTFVAEYEKRKLAKMKYVNLVHEIPVMTRQEINLSLNKIVAIQKQANNCISVTHELCNYHSNNSVELQGFSESHLGNHQPALDLTG